MMLFAVSAVTTAVLVAASAYAAAFLPDGDFALVMGVVAGASASACLFFIGPFHG